MRLVTATCPAAAALARPCGALMLLPSPPVCTSMSEVAATAVCSGAAALAAQLVLVTLFKRSSDRVLQRSAGYTAHHIIAFAFMLIATAVGFAGWFSPNAATATAASRVLAPDGTARWLAAMLFGELVLWDFPCALFVAKLREPIMIAHHVGMLATAYLVALVPSFWGTFYLGWTELSSIPMQLWEAFKNAHEVAEQADCPAPTKERLAKIRDVSYSVFGALWLPVRIFAFTGITARGLYPDVLSLLRTSAASASTRVPLIGFLFFSAAFNALMLYSLAAAAWDLVRA
eukprot:864366-Prymnesium_polylepis.1